MTHPMMRNYFNADTVNLFNSIVREAINFAGIDCWHIPRDVVTQDIILNEVALSRYKEATKIPVLREETGGFYPNDFMLQKFGPEYSGGNTVFAVSKTEFTELTGLPYPGLGDLLVFTDVKQIFQVNDLDTRDPWISNGKTYYWQMKCRPFEKSLHTDIKEDLYDYVEPDTEDLLRDFLVDNALDGVDYFTADSICISIDTTMHYASEDLHEDYFLPVTADREDLDVSANDWRVDIDWDANHSINNESGPAQLAHLKYPNAANHELSVEADLYKVSTNLGF